jgi:hypothetical protein
VFVPGRLFEAMFVSKFPFYALRITHLPDCHFIKIKKVL